MDLMTCQYASFTLKIEHLRCILKEKKRISSNRFSLKTKIEEKALAPSFTMICNY